MSLRNRSRLGLDGPEHRTHPQSQTRRVWDCQSGLPKRPGVVVVLGVNGAHLPVPWSVWVCLCSTQAERGPFPLRGESAPFPDEAEAAVGGRMQSVGVQPALTSALTQLIGFKEACDRAWYPLWC